MNMNNCTNFKNHKTLIRHEYKPDGKLNQKVCAGYICSAFLSEGDVIHMIGIKPEMTRCDRYEGG